MSWQPISTFNGEDRELVDLWLEIYALPRSFGMGDSCRVVDCWRESGKWFHRQSGRELELFADYVTHWMPAPQRPLFKAPKTHCLRGHELAGPNLYLDTEGYKRCRICRRAERQRFRQRRRAALAEASPPTLDPDGPSVIPVYRPAAGVG
jgi:hypothetical protein